MSPNKPVDAASPSNAAHKTNNSDKPKTIKRLRVRSPDDEAKRKNAKFSCDAPTSKDSTFGHILAMFGAINSNSDDNSHLIETDADLHTLQNDFGYTVLHMAAHCSNYEEFQIRLVHDFDVNAKAKVDLTPLHLAALMANDKIVKMLIEHNVDVNCRTKDSQLTPLHLASTIPFVSKVYRDTAEFNLMNKLLVTPLYDRNPVRVIELLVESGAEVNARDAHRNTPLHVATVQSHEKVIEALLKFGAYVDVKNVEGDLPLHKVLKSFNVDGLTRLLEFGADINDISNEFQGIQEYESSQANAFCNSVLEHTNKLRAADLPVAEVYRSNFHKSFWLSHLAECSREVERLKMHFVEDKVSLYDFLHMNLRRRRAYVKYVPLDLEMKFPKYYGIVYGSCRQAEVRRSLVELAKVVWERLTEIELPDVCLEYIFSFLDNSDLTFFCRWSAVLNDVNVSES